MHANFVDRLLARVDGEVATIWITELITTDAPPDTDDLRLAFARLVDETGRLHLAWDPDRTDWTPRRRSSADVIRAFCVIDVPSQHRSLVEALLRAPLDLSSELPLRVTVAPLSDGAHGRWLIALQLHHAVGDARSFMFLNRRLWQLLSRRERDGSRLGDASMTDGLALAGVARHALALPALLSPRHRVLARRGQGLSRRSNHVGSPTLATLRVPLDPSLAPEARSALYYGALLAGMVAHDDDRTWTAPIRLRVPVDLRRALGVGVTLENACSAVPVELLPGLVRECASRDPRRLGGLVPSALSRLLGEGVHWATVLEVLAVSRAASTATLRTHARPDLLADVRASTMVTTYVGTVDRYFEDAPFPVRTLRTHTPTWGSNGFCFGDALGIHVSAFEGLWDRSDLDRFLDGMATWLRRTHGLESEEVG